MIGQYLIHCYLYYILDQPVISDAEFGQLCKDLQARYDKIDHPHNHLISKADLRVATFT